MNAVNPALNGTQMSFAYEYDNTPPRPGTIPRDENAIVPRGLAPDLTYTPAPHGYYNQSGRAAQLALPGMEMTPQEHVNLLAQRIEERTGHPTSGMIQTMPTIYDPSSADVLDRAEPVERSVWQHDPVTGLLKSSDPRSAGEAHITLRHVVPGPTPNHQPDIEHSSLWWYGHNGSGARFTRPHRFWTSDEPTPPPGEPFYHPIGEEPGEISWVSTGIPGHRIAGDMVRTAFKLATEYPEIFAEPRNSTLRTTPGLDFAVGLMKQHGLDAW